jgi:hypothetical protein
MIGFTPFYTKKKSLSWQPPLKPKKQRHRFFRHQRINKSLNERTMSGRLDARKERMYAKLKHKTASLADDFEYRVFIIFHHKDKQTPPLVYEVEKVGLTLTNASQRSIQDGVRKGQFSQADADALLQRDTVQIHAARWAPLHTHRVHGTFRFRIAMRCLNEVSYPHLIHSSLFRPCRNRRGANACRHGHAGDRFAAISVRVVYNNIKY